MTKDLFHNVKAELGLIPAQVTGAVTGLTVDTQDYESCKFVAAIGAVATADGSNFLSVKLFEGDAANMSDEAEVAAADLLGSLPVINATAQANSVQEVGYIGTKRYLRAKVVETGTADATFGGVFEFGDARRSPVQE